MSKPIEKAFGILNPVFPSGDVLVLVGTREFWAKEFKKRRMPEDSMSPEHAGGVLELERKDWHNLLVVVLPEADFKIDWYGTLSHEISHLVDHVAKEVRACDGETRAYLQDFYTRTILAKLLGVRMATFKERHFGKKNGRKK